MNLRDRDEALLRHLQRLLGPGWALCPPPPTRCRCTQQACAWEHSAHVACTRTAARRVGTLRPHDLVLPMKRGRFTATTCRRWTHTLSTPSQMNTHTVLFPNNTVTLLLFCWTTLLHTIVYRKSLNPHKLLASETDCLLQPPVLKICLPFSLPTRECCISFPLGFISLLERLTFLEIVHSFYLRFRWWYSSRSPAPRRVYLFIAVDAVPLLTGQACPPLSTLLVFLFLCSYFYLFYFFYFVSIFKGKTFGTVDNTLL